MHRFIGPHIYYYYYYITCIIAVFRYSLCLCRICRMQYKMFAPTSILYLLIYEQYFTRNIDTFVAISVPNSYCLCPYQIHIVYARTKLIMSMPVPNSYCVCPYQIHIVYARTKFILPMPSPNSTHIKLRHNYRRQT